MDANEVIRKIMGSNEKKTNVMSLAVKLAERDRHEFWDDLEYNKRKHYMTKAEELMVDAGRA